MKDIFAVLGVFFLIGLLMVSLSDSKESDDQAIKDKISIIALAENSDEPVVQSQGEIAKKELSDLQAAKRQALLEEKKAQAEEAKEKELRLAAIAEQEVSPAGRFLDTFKFFIVSALLVGFASIFITRLSRSRYL